MVPLLPGKRGDSLGAAKVEIKVGDWPGPGPGVQVLFPDWAAASKSFEQESYVLWW